MGLNFTSTYPSITCESFFTHQGKSPRSLCFSTLGFDGALTSRSTVQRDVPRPVTPAVHPEGAEPVALVSKLIISAMTCSSHCDVTITADPYSSEARRSRRPIRRLP